MPTVALFKITGDCVAFGEAPLGHTKTMGLIVQHVNRRCGGRYTLGRSQPAYD